MAKILIFFAILGSICTGKLDGRYLPPNSKLASLSQYGKYPAESDREIFFDRNPIPEITQKTVVSSKYLSPNNHTLATNMEFPSSSSSLSEESRKYVSDYEGQDRYPDQYQIYQQYLENYYSQQSTKRPVPIINLYNNPNDGDGGYSYSYETADGVSAEEQGKRGGAFGGYSYISPEGEDIFVQYTADEHGFHPQGSHIPPIPIPIQKSIEKNLAEEARGEYDDGSYKEQHYDDGYKY